MSHFSIGLDYGTSSCRAVIVDLSDGSEVAEAVAPYPSGVDGVVISTELPDLARQEPADYRSGMEHTLRESLARAKEARADFDPGDVVGVAFATTGSTPIPVDIAGVALADHPRFADRPAAKAWLWKDHTAHEEAARITELAWEHRPELIRACGGTYSAEWFWAKILHCREEDPEVFEAAYSWVELCDYIVGVLTGTSAPSELRRTVTAAGHKAMYADSWGGLPDVEFLAMLDPALADLRERLYDTAWPAARVAGHVTAEWAERTGLVAGTPVAVGHFDAHAAGIAAGAKVGTFVKVMGTSTCDVTVIEEPAPGELPDIPGMCGVVRDSVVPGFIGVEAGQSAVGDIFNWFAQTVLGADEPARALTELGERAASMRAGEHGLLALDWFNGNRSVLVDQRLSGLIVGLTLRSEPHHILRALVEATAFGARRILETVEANGTPIDTVVAAGGLPTNAQWMMQVYADVFGRDITIASTSQGSAHGAAIVAAVAGGHFESIEAAQGALAPAGTDVVRPDTASAAVYDELYADFTTLHDTFAASGALGPIMKRLLDIRDGASR
jgi:L-ribulokinase